MVGKGLFATSAKLFRNAFMELVQPPGNATVCLAGVAFFVTKVCLFILSLEFLHHTLVLSKVISYSCLDLIMIIKEAFESQGLPKKLVCSCFSLLIYFFVVICDFLAPLCCIVGPTQYTTVI